MAEYDVNGAPKQVLEGDPETTADSAEPDSAPRPWYRSRVLLALWILMVALLLTLIIYGMVELTRGGGTSPNQAPHSSTTSSQSSTTSSTATTTTPSDTSEAPPPGTPQQTPEEEPPPANNSPAPAEPPQHHHHPHLPSTIPLPHTTITLPHHF
jgi:cytoskeletal protein RodZ